MVLAAGFGLRMRPLTERLPKPLIEVGGQTLIDRTLDRLAAAGVEHVVVNTHHLADMVKHHLSSRDAPRASLSHESEILDTGGGVAKALPELGPDPFFVSNSDVIVLDGVRPALQRLAEAWDEARMDALLLVHPTVRAYGYDGVGDFAVDGNGLMRRRAEREVAPYLFAGVQILHPRLFEGCPDGPFSLNLLYDKAELADRLYGVVHDGVWMHIGTPQALDRAEHFLQREVF